MFFYIDESGQTGNNLFDESQPYLCYGVLSSRVNLDILAEPYLKRMREKLGVERLHANHHGNKGLKEIAFDIEKARKEFDIKFDMYRVAKKDHALICFFDQVFDQGVNPAVPWSSYWTPLKYMLLLKVAYIFTEDLLKKAWEARITIRDDKAESLLVEVCEGVLERAFLIPDERGRELVEDALRWVIRNPSSICYNVSDKAARLQISPNFIGFQSVMHGIASRLELTGRKARRVVVDRQAQFNDAQKWIADFYDKAREVPWVAGPGLPVMNLKNIPDVAIDCVPGDQSAGLELVDVYLWVFKRLKEEKELAPEIYILVKKQLAKAKYDEVSLNAISERWAPWFENLPEPDAESREKGKELRRHEEERRKPYIVKS